MTAPTIRIGIWVGAAVVDLVRPGAIGAGLLLLLNDHVLKFLYPSWVTGKLSDVVGIYVGPQFVFVVGLAAIWCADRLAYLDSTLSAADVRRL